MAAASEAESSEARAAAAAAAAGPAAAAAEPGSASSSGQRPSVFNWQAAWRDFLQYLHAEGHYSADPGVAWHAVDRDVGAMKRAVLSLGRQRPDILHVLDAQKMRALVLAGFPVDDRKTKNAHKRLKASIVDGRHLPPADGGPAELQDLLRIYLSLAGASKEDAQLFRPLVAAAMDLLPDIAAAAAAPPSPEAAAAAAAQGVERYMPHAQRRAEAAAQPKPPGPRQQQQGWQQGGDRRGPAAGGRGGGGGGRGGGGRGGGRGGRGAGSQRWQERSDGRGRWHGGGGRSE